MVLALPSRVMNYKVSAVSPTDELITIGQILSEVGDYAASFLDREHLAVARMCATRLKKIVPELIRRGVIASEDGLYEISGAKTRLWEFSSMTVDDLHRLYRQWPLRHKTSPTDFHLEAAIVRELATRTPANRSEQLKIDYCALTFANECESRPFNS